MSIENMIWSEKYRPKTIDEIILPKSIIDQAKGFVSSGNMPALLFTGSAGVGKTTLAQAIASEIGADFMKINASNERNVDLIRVKLSQFASTVSFTENKKITLLDEADGLTAVSQQALRGFIEEFSSNHTIIFTCNFSSKLIEPLKSRCKVIDFKISAADKTELATRFLKRVIMILEKEGVEFEKRAVAELVMKKFPDFRSVLNELQGYASGGKIDSGILLDLSDTVFDNLINSIKRSQFNEVRKWIRENSDIEPSQLYKIFYDKALTKLDKKCIPEFILLLGEYSYRSSFVIDQEINTAAFLTALMRNEGINFL